MVAKLPCRSISEHSSRLLSIWLIVARPARIDTGMLRKTKQMIEDDAGAGQLDRRHVEGDDVADADDRAGNGEAQHGDELERRLPDEALPVEQIGGEQADRRGQRRGDRRELDRREEGRPRPARSTAADGRSTRCRRR